MKDEKNLWHTKYKKNIWQAVVAKPITASNFSRTVAGSSPVAAENCYLSLLREFQIIAYFLTNNKGWEPAFGFLQICRKMYVS